MNLISYYVKSRTASLYRGIKEVVNMARFFRATLSPFEIIQNRGKPQPKDYPSLIARNKSWVYTSASRNSVEVAQVAMRLFVTTGKNERKPRVPTAKIHKSHEDYLRKSSVTAPYLTKAIVIEEVLEHPFLRLMKRVNPHTTGFILKELLELDQELTGDAYVYVVPDSLGVPVQLWRLPSQYVTIVPGRGDEFIKGYIYGKSRDNQIAFTADEVIHFRFPNPGNMFYGLSPLEAILDVADVNKAMDAYDIALLKNQGRPDFAIIYKDRLADGQREKLRKEWRRIYGGVTKSGKAAILDEAADIKELGFSPREMAFLQGKKWTRDEIAAAYGVPISKLTVENVNKANGETGNIQYARDTIRPRLLRMEETWNMDLIQKFDERLFVAFDNPVSEDTELRLKVVESHLKTGYSTVNQERQIDNLAPQEDYGDVPLLPPNVVPLGSPPPAQAGGEPKAVKEVHVCNHDEKLVSDPMDSDEVLLWRILRKVFDEQAEEILSQIKMEGLAENKIGMVGGFIINPKWDAKIAKLIKPVILKRFKKKGDSALRAIGFGGAADTPGGVTVALTDWVERPESVQFLRDHTIQVAKRINKTTREQLTNSLADGLQAGESIPDLKKRVGTEFLKRKNSAEMIARTEINKAENGGQLEAWKRSGVVTALEWSAQPDSCPFCQELDGKIVGIGDVFVPEGGSVEAVRNGNEVSLNTGFGPVVTPPLHPNDRCTLLPVLKEVELMAILADVDFKGVDLKIIKSSLLYHARNKGGK